MTTAKNEKSHQLAFRLPHELVAWLQQEADRRSAETPGMKFSVSDVARIILTTAMASGGAPKLAPTPTAVAKTDAKTTEKRIHAALLAALKAGRKQAELADAAGIDRGALSRFKGKGTGIAPERLAALAKVLGSCALKLPPTAEDD